MIKYYLGIGDMDLTESNALAIFEKEEEAGKAAEEYKKEILAGVYDEELGIESEEERATYADDVFMYLIEYTTGGSIRKKTKL